MILRRLNNKVKASPHNTSLLFAGKRMVKFDLDIYYLTQLNQNIERVVELKQPKAWPKDKAPTLISQFTLNNTSFTKFISDILTYSNY
jgi:hypothetical protein